MNGSVDSDLFINKCVFLCVYAHCIYIPAHSRWICQWNTCYSTYSDPELDCICAFPQDEEQNELSSAAALSAAGECFHFLATEKYRETKVTNGNCTSDRHSNHTCSWGWRSAAGLSPFSAGGEIAGPCADGDKKKDGDADKVNYSHLMYACHTHTHTRAQMRRESSLSFVMTGQERA